MENYAYSAGVDEMIATILVLAIGAVIGIGGVLVLFLIMSD